jgi:hypothetical protein
MSTVTVETAAAISTNELYLAYVKQTAVGILTGALRVVAANQKLTPNDSLAMFFHPPNKNLALSLMFDLLKVYIQKCCDEFCSIYNDVYIEAKVPFKEALDLNGNHYVFSHFNKIFENSRSNIAAGPKHLNCLAVCTLVHYMPLLFPTILTNYEEHEIVSSTNSRDGNWNEAEKNMIRFILQAHVEKSINCLNVNKQEELKKMPFVCKDDDSCNKNWNLFNFSEDKQAIAVQNVNKFWSELQGTQQQQPKNAK